MLDFKMAHHLVHGIIGVDSTVYTRKEQPRIYSCIGGKVRCKYSLQILLFLVGYFNESSVFILISIALRGIYKYSFSCYKY